MRTKRYWLKALDRDARGELLQEDDLGFETASLDRAVARMVKVARSTDLLGEGSSTVQIIDDRAGGPVMEVTVYA